MSEQKETTLQQWPWFDCGEPLCNDAWCIVHGGLQSDPKGAGQMLDNFGLQVDLKPEPKTGPEDWDPPDPRWPPIQINVPAEHHNCHSYARWAQVVAQCTPSRRETLTGGLSQIWNGAKQVIGALKP